MKPTALAVTLETPPREVEIAVIMKMAYELFLGLDLESDMLIRIAAMEVGNTSSEALHSCPHSFDLLLVFGAC